MFYLSHYLALFLLKVECIISKYRWLVAGVVFFILFGLPGVPISDEFKLLISGTAWIIAGLIVFPYLALKSLVALIHLVYPPKSDGYTDEDWLREIKRREYNKGYNDGQMMS